MSEKNELRGYVAAEYGSCTKFAERLGWSGNKTRNIVSGRQVPNAADIQQMATALNITDPAEFMRIFFSQQSTM